MKRFIVGESRSQSTLFPASLDNYVSEDNSVRVIDVFVDELDLGELGFNRVEPRATGRPAYHPSILLKLYVYGYMNRIHSSRRLERESQRNVEVMWLTGRLMPDFKTIADFRKDNGKAIQNVCREFVALCRKLNLLTESMVAIDGSKFKAVNARDKNFTQAKMKRRMDDIDKSIAEYLRQLDTADRQEDRVRKADTTRLKDKIAKLKDEMKRLKKMKAEMLKQPDKQISLTDPDARSMKTRGNGIVGYNVQTAVDVKNHLIVEHKVTNRGSDRGQLSSMAKKARQTMGAGKFEVVADRGYYKSIDIKACDDAGIITYLPEAITSRGRKAGRFTKQDFRYLPDTDEYLCPSGERLQWHFTTNEHDMNLHCYWSFAACSTCSIRQQCTTSPQPRRIKRWEHESVLEAMKLRLKVKGDAMRIRRQTVEHPFGTIKAWMGATHFLTRTIDRVSTEMSMHVLAYNLKRVIRMMGVREMVQAIRA